MRTSERGLKGGALIGAPARSVTDRRSFLKTVGWGVLILAGGCNLAGEERKEETMKSSVQVKEHRSVPVPPIDLAASARTETATFAFG